MNFRKTLIIAVLLVIPVLAQNVEIADYKVPISRATTLRFNGNWNFAQTGDSTVSNNASGSLAFLKFYTSQPLAWFMNVDATGGKSFKDYNHNVKFQGSFRKYVWEEEDYFGQTTVSVQHANSYQQINSDIVFGFGYGRYIKATALAKAVRIENHLLKENILAGRLPKPIMLSLANIIERQDEYRALYSSIYENAWMRDMEYEIQRSDSLKDESVGSLGILRMRQVLFGINETVNERYYGWDITAGFKFKLTTFDKSPVGDPNLSLTSRFSLPLGWSSQFNSTADISTPMDSLFFKEYTMNANLSFIYEMTNMINIVSSYTLTSFKPAFSSMYVIHNLNLAFQYYIENAVTYNINSSLTKETDKPQRFTINMGIQYNFY